MSPLSPTIATIPRCFLPPAPYYLHAPTAPPLPCLLRPIIPVDYLPSHLVLSAAPSLPRRPKPCAAARPSAFYHLTSTHLSVRPTTTPLVSRNPHANPPNLYRRPRARRPLLVTADVKLPAPNTHQCPRTYIAPHVPHNTPPPGGTSTTLGATATPSPPASAERGLPERVADRVVAAFGRLRGVLGFHSLYPNSNTEPEAPHRRTVSPPAQAQPT